MKQLLRRALLNAVSRVTGRSAVLLASEASRDEGILSVVAPYRVDGDTLTLQIGHRKAGEMRVVLDAGTEHDAADVCRFEYVRPGPLTLQLGDGALSFSGRGVGNLSGKRRVTARRFSIALELIETGGVSRRRTTSHYLPRDGRPVDDRYFTGEDYIDYEAQSEAVHREVVELARCHRVGGRVLEIGCATGGTLAALRAAGFDACGLDVSSWAVEAARRRVGDIVWHCDIERDAVPAAVAARGPFDCFVLASVLEHFAQPNQVLAKLAELAAPGATLIVLTTNADSLTHRLLGSDWEGYFDWTHKGVDVVTPRSLRRWLVEMGWTPREMRTSHLWNSSADPTHATLREWHAADARFRALLAERELGDFITCVAVRG
jgi:2-polyprenyl-3-methyl-5-hydroxy-6-metoxy-1,4-benzoquinol methylase